MKPLPVVALTDEDWSIWCRVMYRWPGGGVGRPAGGYYKADRRDAELMLTLRKGACPLCLGEVKHTVECVEWRWDIYRVNAMRRRLQRI